MAADQNALATMKPNDAGGANGALQLGEEAEQRPLRGEERAAALLLALGPEHARPIMEEMDEMELRQISRAMSSLGPITPEMLDELLIEFVTQVSSNGSVSGNAETTERLLLSFLDAERVDTIMEEIRGPAGRTIWEKLSNVQEEVLATYLKNEYPQTVAVVLSKLSTDHASRLLSIFPEEMALDVVNRMLSLDAVQKDVLQKIEATLRTEFMSTLSHTQRRDSHEQMADIFNAFDRQTETRFMTSLEDANREAADRIKELMFTFDDLVKLDASALQKLVQVLDKSVLVMGLKGASDEAKEKIFSNMSARAAKMAKDDMEAMGPVRLSDVDEAQGKMVNTAKDMAARGEIVVTKGQNNEEMIG